MILLEDRGVIQISGADATSFLQGLITNDVNQATADNLVYTAMLTPQGKFLYDFFILKTADGYLLDCYKPTIAALIKKLSIYKLRSDVTIKNVSDIYAVYSDSVRGLPDPRLPEFGKRLITGDKPETNAGFAAYEKKRIEAGLPESADFLSEDDFPMQCNLEQKACDLSVVIRTLVISGKRYEFQVGGGIVADSVPEREYEETISKASGILKVLGLDGA